MVHDPSGGGGRQGAGPEGDATWLLADAVEAFFRPLYPVLELHKTDKGVIYVDVSVGSNPVSDNPGQHHGLRELHERGGMPAVLRCRNGEDGEYVSAESVLRVINLAMGQYPEVRHLVKQHLSELMGDLGPPDEDSD